MEPMRRPTPRPRLKQNSARDADTAFIRKISVQFAVVTVILLLALLFKNVDTPVSETINANVQQYITQTVDFELALQNIMQKTDELLGAGNQVEADSPNPPPTLPPPFSTKNE